MSAQWVSKGPYYIRFARFLQPVMVITEILPRFLAWFKIKDRGQDGGVDKHTLAPHITKTKITT